MRVFSGTDIGQKRRLNQDFIYTSEEPIGNLPNLFVVADGMGGHNAGDFASRYGVSVLVESVRRDKNFNPVKILRNAIEAANREVLAQSRADASMAGMGTTMVACTIAGGYLYVANVGDSRLYVAGETMTQITQDHSLIAEMVRLGELTPEEGRNHPDKNIITRAVGVTESVNVDFFRIERRSIRSVLLCSDGLTNMVEDAKIEQILKDESLSVSRKVKQLVSDANAAGGRDNITVVLIDNDPLSEVSESC